MALDRLLADRQADSGTRIIGPAMEALKEHEDAFLELWIDADAVIANAEDPFLLAAVGVDMDPRRLRSPELDGIADQVLQHMDE